MFKLSLVAASALALVGCAVDPDTVDPQAGTQLGTSAAPLSLECNTGQVLVCHMPPGNPANMHEVCVGVASLPAHLAEHTDTIPGPCVGLCSGLEVPCLTSAECCSPFECVYGQCVSQT